MKIGSGNRKYKPGDVIKLKSQKWFDLHYILDKRKYHLNTNMRKHFGKKYTIDCVTYTGLYRLKEIWAGFIIYPFMIDD